jgi:hypothetical protein
MELVVYVAQTEPPESLQHLLLHQRAPAGTSGQEPPPPRSFADDRSGPGKEPKLQRPGMAALGPAGAEEGE